tara:strand:+ start:516 stop:968 length:453 start_codon:yes stop_codon:yes gene_type:complete
MNIDEIFYRMRKLNLTQIKPYQILAVFVIVPTLIVTNYRRIRWNICGKQIYEQNQIWEKEIKPVTDESLERLLVGGTGFFDSAFTLTSLVNIADSWTDIYMKGKGIKYPSAICKAEANRVYKKWMQYPFKKILKGMDNIDYYSIYSTEKE